VGWGEEGSILAIGKHPVGEVWTRRAWEKESFLQEKKLNGFLTGAAPSRPGEGFMGKDEKESLGKKKDDGKKKNPLWGAAISDGLVWEDQPQKKGAGLGKGGRRAPLCEAKARRGGCRKR